MRKDRDARRLEPKVRALVNSGVPLRVINVIAGGPSCKKAKNKRTPEDMLSFEKDPWARKEMTFRPSDETIESSHNDPLV